jgi:V/A-type H+-transporting ATPase subunit B
MAITYNHVDAIEGSLIFLKPLKNHNIRYGSIVEIQTPKGRRHGRIIKCDQTAIVAEVFEGTFDLNLEETRVTFTDEVFTVGISREMMGRTFNGLGLPLDGRPILPEVILDINGSPLNPFSRAYPTSVIQTGISTIDGLNTLVRGQKIPIFSGQGLPHNPLAAHIVNNAKVTSNEPFIVIFCGIGLLAEDAQYFREKFEERGTSRLITFLNLASDPPTERLIVPRVALTTAEFLAFEHNMHVLVILTDMTLYAEALRELSNQKGEIPARKGYPGYMYSDFASIYERAGRIKGKIGSITQIPIITMPNDDISHPVPDLTGYITEGQIVLSREYHQRGLYPPVNILSSLSRLMKEGVGEGKTREDHADVSSQLYAFYSRALEIRELESVVGRESLTNIDLDYLDFAELFERHFINQSENSERTFEETLNLGWKLISLLKKDQILRVKKDLIEKYYQNDITRDSIF